MQIFVEICLGFAVRFTSENLRKKYEPSFSPTEILGIVFAHMSPIESRSPDTGNLRLHITGSSHGDDPTVPTVTLKD